MNDGVGSLQWGRRTRGILSRGDRIKLVFGAVRSQAASGLRKLGRSPATDRIDLDLIRLPDTAVVALAEEEARDVSADFLFNHCLRTYFWGALLAQIDALPFDPEILAVAAFLHDLGFSKKHGTSTGQCCFAVAGAEGALKVLRGSGWPVERCETVAKAISLHINVSKVSVRQGAEAHLLQAGAVLDVIGARYHEIPEANVREVLALHPRLRFKDEFSAIWHAESEVRRGTRAALMDGPLNLRRLIEGAPFAE